MLAKVNAAGLSVSTAAGLIATAVELLAANVAAPEYSAVTVKLPEGKVTLPENAPALRVTVVIFVPVLDTSATVPVGVPVPLVGLTVMVAVSAPPEGSAVELNERVVVVGMGVETTDTGAELLAAKAVLPAYSAVTV